MKYRSSRQKYLHSLIILVVGITALFILTFLIKPTSIKKEVINKPNVNISLSKKFIYVLNTKDGASINIYNLENNSNNKINTLNNNDYIQSVNLIKNQLLYLHGSRDLIINLQSKKTTNSLGDYISPNGEYYISIANQNTNDYYTSFNLLNLKTNINSNITTLIPYTQLGKILGWSSDSNNFYFTDLYQTTTSTPEQVTDHWMQKINNKLMPMSRVRDYIKYSTKSAEFAYSVNIPQKKVGHIFENIPLGIIRNIFFNNFSNKFYIENDDGLYVTNSSPASTPKIIPIPTQEATSIVSMVFSTLYNQKNGDIDTFLHSDGKNLFLANSNSGDEDSVYYASGSALLIPLALVNNYALFSLNNTANVAGEIVDMNSKVRIEFVNQNNNLSLNNDTQSILFGGWLKNISVNF